MRVKSTHGGKSPVLHDDYQAGLYVGQKLDISNISHSLRVSNNLSEVL